MEEYNGQYRDGDRIYVDKPLKDIIQAENDAVKSIVFGAVGVASSVLVFGFIFGILGIYYCDKAKLTLNTRHHKYHVATVGLILGWISIALSAVMFLSYIGRLLFMILTASIV